MRQAKVYYKNDFAGIIQESEDGFEFQYTEEYLSNRQEANNLKVCVIDLTNHRLAWTIDARDCSLWSVIHSRHRRKI